MICADCGVEIELVRGQLRQWGMKTPYGHEMTCRRVTDPSGLRLLRADYHYVEGEVQRHFVATDG